MLVGIVTQNVSILTKCLQNSGGHLLHFASPSGRLFHFSGCVQCRPTKMRSPASAHEYDQPVQDKNKKPDQIPE